ncbi:DUF3630 family protein [Photobacterium sp. GB-210]|uniref:DUF3630 family protein n=1 Tax=Photobacterium sp. GB-210 TaxID=2022104 RepID=UPI000D16899B|nr:DUF3630 family protein [Photobacterium sp. GB-210]PSV35665.1 DUF3630 domain-containing protein [Photobacterium sp. GB-210]
MTAVISHVFGIRQFDRDARFLSIKSPAFDFDSFDTIAESFLLAIDAKMVEKESNADLHIWLIDFEGCRLLLKGEHYSGELWLEAMSDDDEETLTFIASLLN